MKTNYCKDTEKERKIRTAVDGRKVAIKNYENSPSRFSLDVVFAWVRLLSKRTKEEK